MATIDLKLAQQWGVPEAAVTKHRKSLQEGTDWCVDGTGRVEVLPPGMSALEAEFCPEKKEGAGEAADVIVAGLVVLRLMPNPTWARVRTPDGKTADVRLPARSRVREGMVMQCQCVDGRWESI